MTAATLKTLVTHNLGLKALALFAAFGLWYSLASEPELATIVYVPIDYKNFPKDLVVSSSVVDSVSVEARGPASRLREMQQTRIAAVIDFASVHAPGDRTFTLTGAELQPPRGVTLVRAMPAQLRFRFERLAKARVHVDVEFSGALPHGLTQGKVTVDPPTLEIQGPESRVSVARKAQTDPFDLSRAATDDTQELSVYMSDAAVSFTGVPRVKVKVRVEKNR